MSFKEFENENEKIQVITDVLIKVGINGDKLQRIMGFIEGMTAGKEYEDEQSA